MSDQPTEKKVEIVLTPESHRCLMDHISEQSPAFGPLKGATHLQGYGAPPPRYSSQLLTVAARQSSATSRSPSTSTGQGSHDRLHLGSRHRGPARAEGEVRGRLMDYQIGYVTKVTCGKCGQEIVGHLFSLPEHRITYEIRREVDRRTKQAHEEGCKGPRGSKPKKYPRPVSKRTRR